VWVIATALLVVLVTAALPGGRTGQRPVPTRDEKAIRGALKAGTGIVELAPGVIDVSSELTIPSGAHDLEIRGASSGTVLRASASFQGRAVLSIRSAAGIRLANFSIDGNRAALEKPLGLPPSDVPFSRYYRNNGVLAEDVESLLITDLKFVNMTNFAILVAGSRKVRIERVHISDSGSRNAAGRNNTTGGILLEEGTAGFEVRECVLRNVRGNGIWTHSLYTSPRNRDGLITGNEFRELARDAIQVGHATNVRVESNRGSRIGYPASEVEPGALPVAIDTAGNTDRSVYAHNRFEEVNGKCIDLDGFHHGEVRNNTCVNRQPREAYPFGHFGIVMNNTNPGMESAGITVADNEIDGAVYGGVFVIGSGHRVLGNRLRNLNQARCTPVKPGCVYWADEPDLLSSGIYLGRRAERPAVTRGNLIRDNEISGFGMKCIAAAPGVSLQANQVGGNRCEGFGSKP
jgi:hypothetical protein